MKFCILLFSILFSFIVLGQHQIDSLIKVFPKQGDLEQSKTLCELCYQLSFNDTEKSIYYGRLAYKAAVRSNDSSAIAQSLNDWSIPYLIDGNFDSVIVLSEQALNIRMAMGDSIGVAKSLNKIANAKYELGLMEEALTNNLRAVKIFEENDLEVYTGQILANIGNIYERNGMFEKAIENYKKGQHIAKINQNNGAYYIALGGEGSCLSKTGKYNEAEVLFLEALNYYKKEQNIDLMGVTYQALGLNARLQKNKLKGKFYYQKALEMYETNNSQIGIALVKVNLGQVFLDENQYDSAEIVLKEGLNLALESRSFFQLKHAYKGLTRLENLKGNYQKADDYFDLYVAHMDSLYNSETNHMISEMQVKYDTAAKTKALEYEQLQNKNNRLLLLLLLILTVILVLLIVLIRHRKKLQAERLKIEGLRHVENERSRIARDLHDNLGAELSLISSKIDIEAFKHDNTPVQEELNRISEISKNANHQLRETIWSIHKPDITLQELGNKIDDYTRRIFNGTSVTINIRISETPINLSPALALNLFRISQETINNTFKYAQAQKLNIILNGHEIRIEDDGTGFNIATVRRGYGLNNIEARVKELNGQLQLSSGESGTKLEVLF